MALMARAVPRACARVQMALQVKIYFHSAATRPGALCAPHSRVLAPTRMCKYNNMGPHPRPTREWGTAGDNPAEFRIAPGAGGDPGGEMYMHTPRPGRPRPRDAQYQKLVSEWTQGRAARNWACRCGMPMNSASIGMAETPDFMTYALRKPNQESVRRGLTMVNACFFDPPL